MRPRTPRAVVCAALLFTSSTSASEGVPAELANALLMRTDAGRPLARKFDAPGAIAELRRIGSLTFEEIARLCGVSRRTVHFWASGRPLDPAHRAIVEKVIESIRFLDRGASDANRTILQVTRADGRSVLDLLALHDYAAARALGGKGSTRARTNLVPIPAEILASRRPPHPADLLNARHETVHRDLGKSRRAHVKRKKGSA